MSELMCLIANYLRRFLPPRVLWTSYMADLDPILPLILSGKDVQVTLELLQQLFTLISSQRLQDKSDTS